MTALTVEDRLEIFELFARYAWAIDEGNIAVDLADVFTDDVIIEGPLSGHNAGEGSVGGWLQAAEGRPVAQMRHIISMPLIGGDVEGGIRVDANFLHFETNRQLRLPFRHPVTEFIFAGRFECTVRQVDGKWRIAKRIAHLDSMPPA